MANDEGSSMDVDFPDGADAPKETSAKTNENVTPSASAEEASRHPDMGLAQSIHKLTMVAGSSPLLDATGAAAADISPAELTRDVMAQVGGSEVENPSLYRHLAASLGWTESAGGAAEGHLSESDLSAMEDRHGAKLAELEGKVEEAAENAGDMEVLDARFDVARFAAKSLTKEAALDAYDKVLALPKLSSGKSIDALMESARVALFHGDLRKTSEIVEKAAKLAEAGGDWDRRNRLKVYSAMSKLLIRDVKGAAALLVDCIATFSCTELCSYTDFVVYTMVSNILHLPRTEIKKKIIDGPEILSVAKDIPVVVSISDERICGFFNRSVRLRFSTACGSLRPSSSFRPSGLLHLRKKRSCVVSPLSNDAAILLFETVPNRSQSRLVNALYDCDYKAYLHAMVGIHPILLADRYLQPHSGYIMRELHVLGYKQFLDSYKSVTLESMATSFGVGPEYLDLQLSRFIAAGRLTAKIDKFGGVVETNRPDLKNAQYKEMIQKGDLLLNRIQKLSRVVDL